MCSGTGRFWTQPLSMPTDDTIKPDRRSDDRDSPATWPHVRSFWAEEQGQVSSFKDFSHVLLSLREKGNYWGRTDQVGSVMTPPVLSCLITISK